MDIRRFGPGHRRADGPSGTQGVAGVVIYHDERTHVSELAFQRFAMVAPHSNPINTALFVVISGGGFVQVGDERARVNHGEAVVWPPEIPHGAYTDGSEMRAIVVEFVGGEGPPDGRLLELKPVADEPAAGEPGAPSGGASRPATPAKGSLAERQILRDEYDTSEGEPW